MSILKKAAVVFVGASSLLLGGTAAHAVLVGHRGTIADQHRFVHQTDPTTTGSAGFTDVPGAAVSVTVPAGQRRMLDARYTAESQCTGGAGGWCSVRLVGVRPNGTLFALDPQSGTDFAFDSVGVDNWEGHAMERTSGYLPAGAYTVKAQAAVVSGATALRLDDWTLAVEVIRP